MKNDYTSFSFFYLVFTQTNEEVSLSWVYCRQKGTKKEYQVMRLSRNEDYNFLFNIVFRSTTIMIFMKSLREKLIQESRMSLIYSFTYESDISFQVIPRSLA